MAAGVTTYSDLPKGAEVAGYSDLPLGASVVSGPTDPLTQQTQAAARTAGAPTGPAPLPPSMRPVPELYDSGGARVRVPANINQAWEDQSARATRLGAAENRAMRSPTPFSDAASVILPAIGTQEAIEQVGLKGVAKGVGKGLLKSAAGSTIGAGVGGGVGSIVGHPKEGAQIGATIGGIAAPFVPGKYYANLPYGLGRIVASPEEYAENMAERKMAQRNADIAAGIREEPDPVAQAVKNRTAAWLPTRIDPTSGGPLGAISSGGSESVAGTRPRSLVLTPEEAASEEQMQSVAKRRASERGMQFAAGMTPREGRSVPRMPTRMAPTEYPGPRETIPFTEEGTPIQPIRGGSGALGNITDQVPEHEDLFKAIMSKTGIDRTQAGQRAEELINRASGAGMYNDSERQNAKNLIQFYMGQNPSFIKNR